MSLTYADFQGGRFNNKGEYKYSDKDHAMTTMTPYAAAKIVNAKLAELKIDKELPPQMLYNYTSKDYIDNIVVEGKKRITNEGLNKWLVGYVKKHFKIDIAASNDEVDEDQMELFEV
jgi:hypothetical protein